MSRLRRDGALALAIVAGVIVLQLPFRLRAVSLADEGAILQTADDLGRGLRLYADAVHYAFPGIFYLTALAFRVLGTSVETARTLAVLVFAVTCGTVYLIARWAHGRRGALAVVVLFLAYRVWAYPHWQMLSYSSLAVTLVLVATWIVGEGLGRRSAWPFVTAGVVSAAAVLAKQDSGLAAAAALGLTLLACRPRAALPFAAGGAFGLAAAALAIWHAGFGPDLVREAILAPLYGTRHFEYLGRPALWPLFRQDPALRAHAFSYFPPILFDLHWDGLNRSALYQRTAVVDAALKLVYHLPELVLAAGALAVVMRLARGGARDDLGTARDLLLILLAAAFLAAFNRPHDWVHLLVLYPPTLLLGSALGARLGRSRLVAGAGWLALGTAAVASAVLAVEFRRHYATPIRSARGVLYARPAQAAALEPLVAELARGRSSVPLAALPYHPLVNFLAARPGVSRYYVVWPVERNESRDEEIVRRLEAHPETQVVYSPTQFPHFPRLAEYAGTLFRYLVDHFAIERTFGGDPDGFTFLLLRRAAPPSGRPLRGAALAAARVRVEPRDGPPRDASAAERAALVGEALWPFARVLRVSTVPDGSVMVVYRLTPAPGERFAASYGVNPERWGDVFVPRVRFTLAVDDGAERRTLLGSEVDPVHDPGARRWAEATVDLSPWAGRPIDVVLAVTGPPGATAQAALAGWGDPRIVSP